MRNRLFIFMALYAEAKPLVKRLQLKRMNFSCGFDVYADQEKEIYLWLTGTGSIAAATAVGSCMTYYGAGVGDVLLGIGTCAAEGEIGEVFLIKQITEQVSGYRFYPDIWYRHGFREAELITVPKVLEQGVPSEGIFQEMAAKDLNEDLQEAAERVFGEDLLLYDMEAAAIYQAAAYYLGPHQLCFLKIISDTGNGKTVTAEMLTALVEKNADRILGQIDGLRQSAAMWESKTDFSSQWQEDCERLCAELHCSQTMRVAVEQCVRYWTLAGVDYQQMLRQMRADGMLPCRDKREGKRRFEELKKRLL